MDSHDQLVRAAGEAGFSPEAYEKVARLLDLLAGLNSHPYLRGRLALKGGTALNLFVFDVPRLSVDIDVNYVGAADLQTMLEERPQVERAIEAVCSRLGLQVRRAPSDHAGGKWRLSLATASGRPGTLELDVNFLLRTPLWPVAISESRQVGLLPVVRFPMLDVHEVAAGKLAALFARNASRDLFETVELLKVDGLDYCRMRLGFVVYGAANRRDWRGLRVEDIHADVIEVDRHLRPMLRVGAVPPRKELGPWVEKLVADARSLVSRLLPLSANEFEFIELLNDAGEIRPDLLTSDAEMQQLIACHPALLWKAKNVREYQARG